jgi:hypothetical protein
MTLDEIICGDDPKHVEYLEGLCRATFSSGAGRELLVLLNYKVPPMMPSIRPDENNDPAIVGYREGLREFSALLYRYSGKPQMPVEPKQNKQQTKRGKQHG